MRLLLYDYCLDGHRGVHHYNIACEALKRGWKVSVLLPPRERSQKMYEKLASILRPEDMCVAEYGADPELRPGRLNLGKFHASQYYACARSLRPHLRRFDFVYTSNLDYMDKPMLVCGAPSAPVQMGGMCMRARFHLAKPQTRAKSRLARLLFETLISLKHLGCVTVSDPLLAAFCDSQKSPDYRKVRYVPEIGMDRPMTTGSVAKQRFGLSQTARVVLVYGALSKRKGVSELLDAIETTDRESAPNVLVVGRADKETEELLARRQTSERWSDGRLTFIAGFADKHTEDAAFAAADVVWAAYNDHSTMSGVFFQALCAEKPIVTANYGIMAWMAQHYRTGISVDHTNPVTTGARIQALLQSPRECGVREDIGGLAEKHRPAAFAAAVCSAIEDSFTNYRGRQ